MKNRKILRLMAALLAIALALCACGGEGGGQTADNGTDAAYQVTVKDAAGNPYTSGVIVRFLSGAEQAGMEMPTVPLPRPCPRASIPWSWCSPATTSPTTTSPT